MYHSFFILLPILGHLGFFHILAIVSNAAMNSRMYMLFQISDLGFFVYIPRSEIARSYQPNLHRWIGVSQMRHQKRRDQQEKHKEDKRILTCLYRWALLSLTAGKMPGGLAAVLIQTFKQSFSSPASHSQILTYLLLSSLEHFQFPKFKMSPLLLSPSLKFWDASPSALLYQLPFFYCFPTAGSFWKSVFHWWPLSCSHHWGFYFSPFLAFSLVGSLKGVGGSNGIWILFHLKKRFRCMLWFFNIFCKKKTLALEMLIVQNAYISPKSCTYISLHASL